jgi:hypothetical protein
MPTISGTVYDSAGDPAVGRTVRAYRRDTGAFLAGAVTGDGDPMPTDPDYASVSLLLHLDGAHASTTFTDGSPAARAVSVGGGSPAISTAESRFGGASLSVSGSSWISTPASADLDFGSGPFTIECWLRRSGSGEFYSQRTGGVFTPLEIEVDSSGNILIMVANAAMNNWQYINQAFNNVTVPANTWTHVALVGTGSLFRCFIEGVEASNSLSYTPLGVAAGPTVIGRGGDSSYSGFIDELRVTKGIARYTANFTPPSAPFPEISSVLGAGEYSIPTSHTGECNVVCLDDAAGAVYNDLILRTTPV